MEAKLKAETLVEDFYLSMIHYSNDQDNLIGAARQCALYCVDEIIQALAEINVMHNFYWSEVRSEIEKLKR